MDNGQRQRTRSAREMTEEIDRATNAMQETEPVDGGLGGMQGDLSAGVGVANEKARFLGRGAIIGGLEAKDTENTSWNSNSQKVGENVVNLTETAVELSEDMNRLENPERFVGDETTLQRLEYVTTDREDMYDELDPNRSLEAKVAYRNQEEVAKDVAPKIEKMLRQPKYDLGELMEVYKGGARQTWSTLGRELGGRN